MADVDPPSITVIESEEVEGGGEGVGCGEGNRSLESLVSRSDSASCEEEEGEEVDAPKLAVPVNLQGKARESSRKNRKISINASVKVARPSLSFFFLSFPPSRARV